MFNKLKPPQNLSWEADILQNERRSRIIAWRVAGTATFTALVLAAAIVLMMPLKRVVPYVVMVDKLTNEAQVVNTSQEFTKTSELSDKHWLAAFLVARERYIFKIVQIDYDKVKLLAADRVWASYHPQFEGSNAIDTRFKDEVEIVPRILSITPTGIGLATVRYELTTRDYRTTAPPTVQRRIATLKYEYQQKAMTVEADAIANPFGFTVTEYRTDSEMFNPSSGPVAPSAPAIPTAPASPVIPPGPKSTGEGA